MKTIRLCLNCQHKVLAYDEGWSRWQCPDCGEWNDYEQESCGEYNHYEDDKTEKE